MEKDGTICVLLYWLNIWFTGYAWWVVGYYLSVSLGHRSTLTSLLNACWDVLDAPRC